MVGQRKENLASYSVSPTQDVLSQMIAESAGEDGFMSEVEIADKILVFLIWGHDTTSDLLSPKNSSFTRSTSTFNDQLTLQTLLM